MALNLQSSSALAQTASSSAGLAFDDRMLHHFLMCAFCQAAEHIAQCMRSDCILGTTALLVLQRKINKALSQAEVKAWVLADIVQSVSKRPCISKNAW